MNLVPEASDLNDSTQDNLTTFELKLDRDMDKLFDLVFDVLHIIVESNANPYPASLLDGYDKMARRILGDDYDEFTQRFKAKYGKDWLHINQNLDNN